MSAWLKQVQHTSINFFEIGYSLAVSQSKSRLIWYGRGDLVTGEEEKKRTKRKEEELKRRLTSGGERRTGMRTGWDGQYGQEERNGGVIQNDGRQRAKEKWVHRRGMKRGKWVEEWRTDNMAEKRPEQWGGGGANNQGRHRKAVSFTYFG